MKQSMKQMNHLIVTALLFGMGAGALADGAQAQTPQLQTRPQAPALNAPAAPTGQVRPAGKGPKKAKGAGRSARAHKAPKTAAGCALPNAGGVNVRPPAAPGGTPTMVPPTARRGAPRPMNECGPGQRGANRTRADLARVSQLLSTTSDFRVRGYLTDARAYFQRAAQSGDRAQQDAGRALLRAAEALSGQRPAPKR